MPPMPHSTLPYLDVLLRLVAALVIGGAIGLNRFLHGKPAGLRTHALVTLSAALVTLIGMDLARLGGQDEAGDVTRVIQGIITGVGFVGGGVILQDAKTRSVRGLTTGVSLWLSACLGIGCGAGAWPVSLTATVLVLLVLTFGGRVERGISNYLKARLGGDDEDDEATPRSRYAFVDSEDD